MNTDIAQMYVDDVLRFVKKDKKVGGFVSSRTTLEKVYELLTKEGISVLRMDGDNGRLEERKGKEMIHYKVKQEVFKDVNKEFDDYQVVLYSSTVTVGISYDKDIFDTCIHLVSPNCGPIYGSL